MSPRSRRRPPLDEPRRCFCAVLPNACPRMATQHVNGLVMMDVCDEHLAWALEICGADSTVRQRIVSGVA